MIIEFLSVLDNFFSLAFVPVIELDVVNNSSEAVTCPYSAKFQFWLNWALCQLEFQIFFILVITSWLEVVQKLAIQLYFKCGAVSWSFSSCPVEFQQSPSWLKWHFLFNASVYARVKFWNIWITHRTVVNVAFSNFDFRAWSPWWNWTKSSAELTGIINAPRWFARVLLEISILNDVFSPSSHTLFFVNRNVFDWTLMNSFSCTSFWTEG